MSRSTIAITITLYFVACLIFAFFEKTQNPFWTHNAATIGETVGGALTVFVLGGSIPIVAWGSMRFRTSRGGDTPIAVARHRRGIRLPLTCGLRRRSRRAHRKVCP